MTKYGFDVRPEPDDVAGSPDEICRKLESLQAVRMEYVLLNGGGTSRENLRRFAPEAMPHFRDSFVRNAAK